MWAVIAHLMLHSATGVKIDDFNWATANHCEKITDKKYSGTALANKGIMHISKTLNIKLQLCELIHGWLFLLKTLHTYRIFSLKWLWYGEQWYHTWYCTQLQIDR
jgi:hypothetical protein